MAPIRPSGRKRDERGAALVEFALCVPLLLVVIAGIVDFGFVFQRYEVITNAAREGARFASLPQFTDNETAIKNRVRAYVMEGLSIPNDTALNAVLNPSTGVVVSQQTMNVTGPGGGSYPVNTTVVTVNYNHSFLLLQPIMGLINASWGNSITLTARSQMRHEQQAGS